VRDTIREMPDFKGMSDEELKEYNESNRISFHFPGFCKLFMDLKKIRILRKLKKLK